MRPWLSREHEMPYGWLCGYSPELERGYRFQQRHFLTNAMVAPLRQSDPAAERQDNRNAQRRGGVHHEVAEVETAGPGMAGGDRSAIDGGGRTRAVDACSHWNAEGIEPRQAQTFADLSPLPSGSAPWPLCPLPDRHLPQ